MRAHQLSAALLTRRPAAEMHASSLFSITDPARSRSPTRGRGSLYLPLSGPSHTISSRGPSQIPGPWIPVVRRAPQRRRVSRNSCATKRQPPIASSATLTHEFRRLVYPPSLSLPPSQHRRTLPPSFPHVPFPSVDNRFPLPGWDDGVSEYSGETNPALPGPIWRRESEGGREKPGNHTRSLSQG